MSLSMYSASRTRRIASHPLCAAVALAAALLTATTACSPPAENTPTVQASDEAEPAQEKATASSEASVPEPQTAPLSETLTSAAAADPAVGPAVAKYGLRNARQEGEWARADVHTDYDGLMVVFRLTPSGWEVVDAGVSQVGCPLLTPPVAKSLGILC